MRQVKIATQAAVLLAALSIHAYAGLRNDVPSCYTANHYSFASKPYQRLAYVLIDQTVILDKQLKKEAINNALRLLGPGTKFVVAEFSAFSQQRYLSVLNTGIIESQMTKSEHDNVPARSLVSFDSCMRGQANYSIGLMKTAMTSAMSAADNTLAQSDIMMALKTISAAISQDQAKQKVVFIVTDGLENSSIMSFYSRNGVRAIDPQNALGKAKASAMMGNFGGAHIYMLGIGVMPPVKSGSRSERDGYRDPKTLERLQQFWNGYLDQSNARLVEFGTPSLVTPVEY